VRYKSIGVTSFMSSSLRLCDMEYGQRAKIIGLSPDSRLYGRLCELGFIPGTSVECLMKSPLGDPVAFLIRGAIIALRRDDSKYIEVEVI